MNTSLAQVPMLTWPQVATDLTLPQRCLTPDGLTTTTTSCPRRHRRTGACGERSSNRSSSRRVRSTGRLLSADGRRRTSNRGPCPTGSRRSLACKHDKRTRRPQMGRDAATTARLPSHLPKYLRHIEAGTVLKRLVLLSLS